MKLHALILATIGAITGTMHSALEEVPIMDQQPIVFINTNALFTRSSHLLLQLKVIALARKNWSNAFSYIKALIKMHNRSYKGTGQHAGNTLFDDSNGNPLYGAYPQMIQNGLIDPVLRPYIPHILKLTAQSHALKKDIIQLLQGIKMQGFRIVIVSNKDQMSYEDVIKELGPKAAVIDEYVDAYIMYHPTTSPLLGQMQEFLKTADSQKPFTKIVERALTTTETEKYIHVPTAFQNYENGSLSLHIQKMINIAGDIPCIYFDTDAKNVDLINSMQMAYNIQAYKFIE